MRLQWDGPRVKLWDGEGAAKSLQELQKKSLDLLLVVLQKKKVAKRVWKVVKFSEKVAKLATLQKRPLYHRALRALLWFVWTLTGTAGASLTTVHCENALFLMSSNQSPFVCVSALFILQLQKELNQLKPPYLWNLRHGGVWDCGGWSLHPLKQAQGGGVTLAVLRLSGVSMCKQLCKLMLKKTVAPMGENKVSIGSLSKIATINHVV